MWKVLECFYRRSSNNNVMMDVIALTLKMLVSIALGALIGLEREWTKKPAGLRTHMLVSLGACLFTIVSIQYFSADPVRVSSGIVTGIGFIGAGTIMAAKGRVHGITTAATLWVVAGAGMAVGADAYLPALIASVLVFLILQLRRVEKGAVAKKTSS
jgi:putative Mg2+ transporter-C (MgtC) family protein